MSEEEYVDRIKQSAQSYIAFIRGDLGGEEARNVILRWEHMKTFLSAHTAIRLCETWLAKDREEA